MKVILYSKNPNHPREASAASVAYDCLCALHESIATQPTVADARAVAKYVFEIHFEFPKKLIDTIFSDCRRGLRAARMKMSPPNMFAAMSLKVPMHFLIQHSNISEAEAEARKAAELYFDVNSRLN